MFPKMQKKERRISNVVGSDNIYGIKHKTSKKKKSILSRIYLGVLGIPPRYGCVLLLFYIARNHAFNSLFKRRRGTGVGKDKIEDTIFEMNQRPFQFDDNFVLMCSLHEDKVDFEGKAAGITFEVIMIMQSQVFENFLEFECQRVVSRVGDSRTRKRM